MFNFAADTAPAFFALLTGELEPTAGTIKKAASLKIVYFSQTRELEEGVTLRRALAPDTSEIEQRGREAAHVARFEAWKASGARPIFKRIGVAVPKDGDLKLYEIGSAEKTLSPASWPDEWSVLRENLQNKLPPNHSGPFRDTSGTLVEFPLFDAKRGQGGAGEIEWMIYELDRQYARNFWIPELFKQYLSANVQGLLTSLEVKTYTEPRQLIFSSGGATNAGKAKLISETFNRQGSSGSRTPSAGGWWVLEARLQPGRIEGLVSAARRRNLAVAVLLNVLLLTAAFALLYHTRRARRLSEAQMNFVTNVSHELRTPLTVIRGAGHNLANGVVGDWKQVERYSKLIIQHADQLAEMVEQVLELGSARKKRSSANQEVDIAKTVKDAVTATTEETEGCQVEVELAPNLSPVSGDASALKRVFQNLVTNAAKHGGKGRWIGITGVVDEHSEPAMVEVQVADRGAGIPSDEMEQIFKPFFRGNNAQADQVRGSGLGLSLVKEIVEAHGGLISVKSNEGQGTIFTVRLPLAHHQN